MLEEKYVEEKYVEVKEELFEEEENHAEKVVVQEIEEELVSGPEQSGHQHPSQSFLQRLLNVEQNTLAPPPPM